MNIFLSFLFYLYYFSFSSFSSLFVFFLYQVDGEINTEDGIRAQRSKKSRGTFSSEDAAAAVAATSMLDPEPDPLTETADWVRWQKRQWRKLNQRKKTNKERALSAAAAAAGVSAAAMAASTATLSGSGLRNYLRAAGTAARTNYWQIVQISEEVNQPGIFNVWVFFDNNRLERLSVEVPRVIYVNTRTPNDAASANGRKVERLLPRGRPCLNLYELSMSEKEYRENQKELNLFLNHKEVEGVYETHVPLLFKILLELGCVCKVDQRAIKEK